MSTSLRTLVIGVFLFPLGLLLHELCHLAVLEALGGTGALVVRPWRFEFLPLALPSLHVTGGPSLDPLRRVLFDLGGPLLAAVPMLAAAVAVRDRSLRAALSVRDRSLRAALSVRDRSLRAALSVNIGILCFFALIETADYLLDSRLGRDLPLITWEEFNYGLPLVTLLLVAALAGRRHPAQPVSLGGT